VAAAASNDVWEVGSASTSDGDTNLIEHWDGTSWSVAPNVPSPGTQDQLAAVAADSSTDAWAVGDFVDTTGTVQSQILHWDGSTWARQAVPSLGTGTNELTAVHAVSASDVYAVGFADLGSRTGNVVLHWDGTSWSEATVPSPGSTGNGLLGVTATSASDVWAAGFQSNGNGLGSTILHWNGSGWSAVSNLPSPGTSNSLTAVSAVPGGDDAWAAGRFEDSSGTTHPYFLHRDGTAWNQVPSVDPGSSVNVISSVQEISATDAWAAGTAFDSTNGDKTLVERWNGTSWSQVSSASPGVSNGFSALTAAAPADVWAAGSTQSPFTVPGVVGESQALATAAIQAEGLGVSVARLTSLSECAAAQQGQVVSASPAAGSRADAGSTVTINVCSLREFQIPNVVGESLSTAEDSMKIFQFVPLPFGVTCTPRGTVIFTNPKARTLEPIGTGVLLEFCK
jgi:hypothetical protein